MELELKTLDKHELIDSLLEVDQAYNNYLSTLSPDKMQRINMSVAKTRHGLHSVAPITCMGPEKCLFIEHCPIPPRTEYGAPVRLPSGAIDYGTERDYPIAQSCIMESFYMRQKTVDYVKHLNVDPSNPVEMSMVNELSLIDLYKNRALIILSKGDKRGDGQDFLKVDMTSYDAETGSSTESTTLHPVADMIDRLEKRRERWLDKLMETRKAKVEMAHKLGNTDTSSKVLEQLQAVRAALEKNSNKNYIDAEVLEIEID